MPVRADDGSNDGKGSAASSRSLTSTRGNDASAAGGTAEILVSQTVRMGSTASEMTA